MGTMTVRTMTGRVDFLPNNVKELREQQGISQETLARRSGTTRQHIHHIELGHVKRPYMPTKLKITRGLGYKDGAIYKVFPKH